MKHPGSRYHKIWQAVRRIPKGKVSTYGAIATLSGNPGQARLVGYALHRLVPGMEIPWHRVINAQGRVSLPGASGRRQLQALLKEGIISEDGKINLKRFGWPPKTLATKTQRH